jgi:hypothetical protein
MGAVGPIDKVYMGSGDTPSLPIFGPVGFSIELRGARDYYLTTA